ncbi:ABC transporter substrate-binding protein [Roseiarcaceae bacterium H3SJ34-1]|uniref:ABC transporter substrate-binding protein n=1 Tax=Terripilifer ovatus TaxID=3032367 RepID=UPI003AB9B43C|nr:ABC transporter substrate-binding protein [Roseiarcaceae bacterium H3SJ34-1]
MDSPSYFVAVAAVELGFFKREGIDIEFVYKTTEGPELMREGKLDFIGGPAFASTRAFPAWKGVKLLCALSRYSYWFLAVRATLDVKRGDMEALKGLRISAAMSWPGMGLEFMLKDAGIDCERDKVTLVPPPPAYGDKGFMARNGVDAIKQDIADAYWGNGMRVALGESLGIAKMHLDLRRGDGPPAARFYNFAALTTSDRLIEEHPDVAAGAVRAIVNAQQALRKDPSLATGIGERLFPADEAELIAELIRRDAPFYDADISHEAVDGLMRFATGYGLIPEPVAYDALVATQFSHLWKPIEGPRTQPFILE